jgi:hypothetical protein
VPLVTPCYRVFNFLLEVTFISMLKTVTAAVLFKIKWNVLPFPPILLEGYRFC